MLPISLIVVVADSDGIKGVLSLAMHDFRKYAKYCIRASVGAKQINITVLKNNSRHYILRCC